MFAPRAAAQIVRTTLKDTGGIPQCGRRTTDHQPLATDHFSRRDLEHHPVLIGSALVGGAVEVPRGIEDQVAPWMFAVITASRSMLKRLVGIASLLLLEVPAPQFPKQNQNRK